MNAEARDPHMRYHLDLQLDAILDFIQATAVVTGYVGLADLIVWFRYMSSINTLKCRCGSLYKVGK